jgi:PAS domain S-box-containing protein
MQDRSRPGRHGYVALSVFGLVAVAIAVGAWHTAALQDREILDLRYKELTSIGQLKVSEIAGWRRERLAGVRALAESPLLTAVIERWLPSRQDPALRRLLERHLTSGAVGNRDTVIVGLDGTLLLGPAMSHESRLEATTISLIRRVAGTGEAIFGDFYRCSICQQIHLDVAAPIRDDGGRLIAVLAQRLDPSRSLYPLLKSWPTASATAETLLVRRDGDQVLFLNELRHRPGTALSWRQPLASPILPAARAAAGQIGRYPGRDYRGREVLSDLRPVPDSPWFVVAKMDLDEALAEARQRKRLVLLLGVLGILFAAALLGYLTRRHQRDVYLSLLEAERERKALTRQADTALRESEERFRATLYSIGDGVITTDTDGLVRRMNRPAEALTGWSEGEATGQPIDDVFHIVNEETRLPVANPVRRVLESGLVVGLANHTVLLGRDGVERPIADSGAPIRTPGGGTHGVVLVFQDQTAQRQAQAHDRWLSSMLQQSVNEVYAFDAGTLQFAYVNGTALARLGYTLDEMRAMTPLDIKPDLSRARFEALIAPVRSGARPSVEFETVHSAKSGERYDVLIVLRLIEGPSGPQFLAIGLDITNRRRLELQLQQAQRIEAVGRLAGGIAHDFNNLLGVINNYADFGLQRADPYSREYFGEIQTAGQRAAVLTRQLLAFSRKQVLQPEVLSLNDVVAGVESLLLRLIGEDVSLSIRLAAAPDKVRADRSQVEQVLMDLAVNARDAMPEGGELHIETKAVNLDAEYAESHVGAPSGAYVLLSVRDTGHGMDEETRRRAFEPFFTTKAVGQGTGMGLSMVYGIVKQSGGYVWVCSEPGRGATFEIYLPTLDEPASTRPAPGVARSSAGTERVLVVEDEPSVRRLACRILEGAGYRVTAAADPLEALALDPGPSGPIHLLVTDVVMPKMSGSQLAGRLLAKWSGMKVLYMSGYTENAIVHHGVLDPGTEFIAKPFTASELTRKVREVLDRDRLAGVER